MATETEMTTDPEGGLSGHRRGILVTSLASLSGVAAALVSAAVVGTDPSSAADSRLLGILAGFVLVQLPLLRLLGVRVGEFGAKDTVYVVFMSFTLWFISLTVLLTAGVTL